jgi:hypothetical protein
MKLNVPLVVAALLCSLTAACIPQGGQKVAASGLERLGEQKLDAKTCEVPRVGTLGVHDGGLWFQDDVMRAQAEATDHHASWEPDEVLLSTQGSGWGQLIPHESPELLIATRGIVWSEEEQRVVAPAQLVTLTSATLAVRPWWEAPATFDDISLLGRAGGALVVLTVGEQGKSKRVWALAPEQSTPLGSMDLLLDAGAPVGPPAAGHSRWPIISRGHGVFLVDVDPAGQLSGGLVKSETRHIARASASEIILHFADDVCARAPLDAPESWDALPRSKEACTRTEEGWELPIIDGKPVAARHAATPSGCQVQHRIILPPLPDLPAGEDALAAGRVAIAQLPPAPDDPRERLLVRGITLTASVAVADESSARTVSAPSFALALPPEALTIELVRVDGQAFWEVRLDLDVPYEPWPACITGQLLFETAEATESPWRRAVIRQYVEFGKCE